MKQNTFKALVLCVLILALVGAYDLATNPAHARSLLDITNFDSITLDNDLIVGDDAAIVGDFDVNGSTTFDGPADFDSTIDLSGATVTYPSVSSLTALTVTGASVFNGGITADGTAFSVANTTGNTVVSGTLTISDTLLVTGTSTLADDLDMSAQPIVNIGNAGTDFGTNGGLTTAQSITITAGSLFVSGVPFSGPMTFGSASNVTNGTLIAHGLGTTPTVVIPAPYFAGVLTTSLYISATNATSFTVGLTNTEGEQTITNVFWVAGK